MVKWDVDYSKFDKIEDPNPTKPEMDYLEPDEALNKAYEAEMVKDRPVDKLREMKIKLAMDAYEKRRPKDTIMHHYTIRDAGDIDAIGDYFQTGDERNGCPIYKNASGITLTREKQPKGDSDEDQFGWILGSIEERRPLYGVMTDDLSVPTLGWQGFTAPEPVPTVRYYSAGAAARMFKDKGNVALQSKSYVVAESWYTKALSTKMDQYEFAEPMAIIHSNRAQVRLLMEKYNEAADDADMALRFLKDVNLDDEPTKVLKKKTFIRRAKALAGMKCFFEAENMLKQASQMFPDCDEISKKIQEMRLARGSDPKEVPKPGPSGQILRFLSSAVQTMQNEVESSASALADAVFPMALTKALLKLEYLLSKADGEILTDLQSLFRTNGGLRTLLHIVHVQWNSNLEGKIVDMYKLDSFCTVLSVLSLACDAEGIQMAVSETPALFAALGGCNRKVDASFCARLIILVTKVWEKCKCVALENVQCCSIVVERAASFLSKLILTDDGDGPDAPALAADGKDKASSLLRDLFATGGRVEKRTLRGAIPMLASFDGTGFLTANDKTTRDLGQSFLQKVSNEPSLLSASDVANFLLGVQLLIMYGPGSSSGVTAIALEGAGVTGSTMRYVDLESWSTSEDGRYAAAMLLAVAKALEFRLLGSHELGKDDYKEAFSQGYGWTVCIPLVQGPAVFSMPAMKCMSAMPSVPACASPTIAAILGFPSPESKPMVSYLAKTLASDTSVRLCAAKLLSKCVGSEGFLDLLRKDGEKCMRELVRLAMNISLDGKGSLEALHDMLFIFYKISQSLPDPVYKHCPEDMLTMLVCISRNPIEDAPQFYAKGILSTLTLNRKCDKMIKNIENRYAAGVGVDPEDALKADT